MSMVRIELAQQRACHHLTFSYKLAKHSQLQVWSVASGREGLPAHADTEIHISARLEGLHTNVPIIKTQTEKVLQPHYQDSW